MRGSGSYGLGESGSLRARHALTAVALTRCGSV